MRPLVHDGALYGDVIFCDEVGRCDVHVMLLWHFMVSAGFVA